MNRLPRRAIALAVAALAASGAYAQTQGEANVLREVSARRDGIAMHRPGLDLALYGLLDLTFVHTSNANRAGDSLNNFTTPWFSGSRWGVMGSRNLPDGAPSVIFKLEGEYVVATGKLDTDNTIFNRDAWVGFYGDAMGKLTFGRQNTLARDFSGNWGDPYTSDGQVTYEERGWTNTNNFKQLINYAASPSGTRWDRGVVYKKQFGPIMAGIGHQFQSPGAGTDPVAGENDRNTSNTAGLAWNGGLANVSGFYNQSDVSGTSTTQTKLKHKSYSIGGNVGVGPMVRVYGGWFHYTAEQPAAFGNRKDNAWTLSGRIAPSSKIDFELGYAHFKADNAGAQTTSSSEGVVVMRNPYQSTAGITAVQSGTKNTVYASAFYHFDRSTEVYVVADRMKTKDGWADPRSFGHTDQTEYGIGIRTRF
jgi:predicted porin